MKVSVKRPSPLLAATWVCGISNVWQRCAANGFALEACSALSFPVHGAYFGFSSVVIGLCIRYTTDNCSSLACWVGQFVVGCRSELRLGCLLHFVFLLCVCSAPCAAPRFPHLSGITHFVLDDLPAGCMVWRPLNVERAAASRGCMGDGLAFSPPGLPVRRGVTSGCVKSGGTLESLSLRVCCCDELKVALLIFAVNSSAAIFFFFQKNRSVAGLVVAQKGIFRFKLCGRAPRKLND